MLLLSSDPPVKKCPQFKASMGAKWTNLVVVSLLSIIALPSDIAILNLYISWNISSIVDDCKWCWKYQ